MALQRQQRDVANGHRAGDAQIGGGGGGFLRLKAGAGGVGRAAVRSPDIDIIAGGQATLIQCAVDRQAGGGGLRPGAGAGEAGVQ